MRDYGKQGRANKQAGAKFELEVRRYLEKKGWLVSKWRNNVDLQCEEIIAARQFYIPGRGAGLGTGFPDFVAMKMLGECPYYFEVTFIEAKSNGYLTKEEKLKLKIMIDMGLNVEIAYKDETEEDGIRLRKFEYTEGVEKIPRG